MGPNTFTTDFSFHHYIILKLLFIFEILIYNPFPPYTQYCNFIEEKSFFKRKIVFALRKKIVLFFLFTP